MSRTILAVLSALGCSSAAGQETPPQILGGIVMALSIMEQCGIDEPERSAALAEAGERLQAHLRLPRQVMAQIAAEMADDASSADCDHARSVVGGETDQLLAKADRVR